jgi:hypothetical protein
MTRQFSAVSATLLLVAAQPAAQDGPRLQPIEMAAACAPVAAAALPADAPKVVGAQDTVERTLFGTRDLLIISAGADRGLQVNQRFYVRRPPAAGVRHGNGPRGASTAGWARIVAVNGSTAIALVEFACDGVLVGDVLTPYREPALPAGADRTDATGELDFMVQGRVLFGDGERRTGGIGDFLVTDLGSKSGAAAGTRVAIYRDLRLPGVPLAAIGEAVVVSVEPDSSVVRITQARNAVTAGDLVVPRRRP